MHLACINKINDKIEILGDKYLEFLKQINKYMYIFGNYVDYEIINKNEYIPDDEYSIITQNDNIIMYKYDTNLYFINPLSGIDKGLSRNILRVNPLNLKAIQLFSMING